VYVARYLFLPLKISNGEQSPREIRRGAKRAYVACEEQDLKAHRVCAACGGLLRVLFSERKAGPSTSLGVTIEKLLIAGESKLPCVE
jgi:hypothetical protein